MKKAKLHCVFLVAINVGTIKDLEDLEELCELAVRALEEIIDYQKYPIKAAEIQYKSKTFIRYRLHWPCTLS